MAEQEARLRCPYCKAALVAVEYASAEVFRQGAMITFANFQFAPVPKSGLSLYCGNCNSQFRLLREGWLREE